jgi:Leucine-rich repeat (LRR) protein
MPDRILKPNALFYVDLSFNALTGTLPINAVSLNLRHLYLSHNQLSGDIPSAYGLLPLEDLFLDNNGLTGTVPTGFSNSLLETLQIQGNQLSDGALDSSLCLLDIFQDGVLVDLVSDCATCSCNGRLCNACV